MFDPHQIRNDFPMLNRLIDGKPIIYLDSTASTPKPNQIIEAENDYYKNYSVNIFRGVYKLSDEATTAYEKARSSIGVFIGAQASEIVFVRNATEAINLVASSWGRLNVKNGNQIVSTVMEHHANIVPWQILSREKQAQLKYIDITGDGHLQLDELIKI